MSEKDGRTDGRMGRTNEWQRHSEEERDEKWRRNQRERETESEQLHTPSYTFPNDPNATHADLNECLEVVVLWSSLFDPVGVSLLEGLEVYFKHHASAQPDPPRAGDREAPVVRQCAAGHCCRAPCDEESRAARARVYRVRLPLLRWLPGVTSSERDIRYVGVCRNAKTKGPIRLQ